MTSFNPAIVNVERGLTELRAGRPVALYSGKRAFLVQAAEAYSPEAFRIMERLSHSMAYLLLSADRVRVLGFSAEKAQMVPIEAVVAHQPLPPLYNPLEGACDTKWLPALQPVPGVMEGALQLVKAAELLPAALIAEIRLRRDTDIQNWAERHGFLTVKSVHLARYAATLPQTVAEVVDARVPLHGIGDVRLKVFRPENGGYEHLAIMIGDWKALKKTPAVRVHSSCLTGDVLGSLRCDCGEQLHQALLTIHAEGGGVLLYLNQEGRGIGLANKLRAYCLQDHGMDTVEANQALGFDNDERAFTLAAALLSKLGIESIRLLTNNPRKIRELESVGIRVTERIAVKVDPNGVNDFYLATKSSKAGHLL